MNQAIVKGYRDNHSLRASFNELAKATFDLSFENWYRNGFWSDTYIPYSVAVDNKIVANVSVNRMDFTMGKQKKRYVQLGTVMTKPEYRNRGYIRALMNQIQNDYADCAGFFLWANDSVLDFYPKFGFQPCKEYRFRKSICGGKTAEAEPVRMKGREDWNRFLAEKAKRQNNGIIQMENDGLLMFYLSQFMQENVYYIKRLDAYVIAEIENKTLILHDVFSSAPVDWDAVFAAFGRRLETVRFAFTPNSTEGLDLYEHKENDSTFFLLGDALENDMKVIRSFPSLAHA